MAAKPSKQIVNFFKRIGVELNPAQLAEVAEMEDRFMEKYDRTEDRFTRRVLAHRFADSLMGYAHNLAEQILSKNKTA